MSNTVLSKPQAVKHNIQYWFSSANFIIFLHGLNCGSPCWLHHFCPLAFLLFSFAIVVDLKDYQSIIQFSRVPVCFISGAGLERR